MKRLKTHTGGMPFVIDDLDYMQDGLSEGIALALSHQYETIILSGFERSTTNGGLTNVIGAGHIFHKGKIYRFDGGTFGATFPYLKPIEHEAPEGNKMYEDQTTKATYIEDKLEITSTASPDYIRVQDLELYRHGKSSKLVANIPVSKGVLAFEKRGDIVHLTGYYNYKEIDPQLLYTIPEGFRPSKNLEFFTKGKTSNTHSIEITQTGLFNIFSQGNSTTDLVSLSISYICQ